MVDHALRQLILKVGSSNKEPKITVLVGGLQISGQVTTSKVWKNSLGEFGSEKPAQGADLFEPFIHMKCSGPEKSHYVIRLNLEAVQGWWLESEAVKTP